MLDRDKLILFAMSYSSATTMDEKNSALDAICRQLELDRIPKHATHFLCTVCGLVELKKCPQCGLDENELLKPSIEGKANEKRSG